MKFLLIIIAFFSFLCSLYSQDFWELINTPNDSTSKTSLLVDSMGSIYYGCWVNYSHFGGVFRSDDDGITWTSKNNGFLYPNQSILSLAQDNKGTIFAGGQSTIFKSFDRAESWSLQYQAFPYAVNFNTIRCGYDSIILVGGSDYDGIIRSGDNGQTWQNVLDISHPGWFEVITDIRFGTNGVIYACSRIILSPDPGMVYASNDLGRTWEIFSEASYPTALCFDNQDRLLRGEFGQGIYRYDFSTMLWEHIPAGGSTPNDILVVPDDRIFLACDYWPSYSGGIMVSDDGGTYYQYINSGLLYQDHSAHSFAVDTSGRILVIDLSSIYRSNDIIFTKNTDYQCDNRFDCFSYPNPFHEFLYFKNNGQSLYDTQILVYNYSSKIVYRGSIGKDTIIKWNTSYLPSGLFLVQFIQNKSTSSMKLLHY